MFENYDERIDNINKLLHKYNIKDIDEVKELKIYNLFVLKMRVLHI